MNLRAALLLVLSAIGMLLYAQEVSATRQQETAPAVATAPERSVNVDSTRRDKRQQQADEQERRKRSGERLAVPCRAVQVRRQPRLSRSLGNQAIQGRLRGNEISFTAGTTKYAGTVDGNTIKITSPSAMTVTKK